MRLIYFSKIKIITLLNEVAKINTYPPTFFCSFSLENSDKKVSKCAHNQENREESRTISMTTITTAHISYKLLKGQNTLNVPVYHDISYA